MKVIQYKGNIYPEFQAQGFAAKFAFPYAKEVCKGIGFDIGCNRLEWSFPDSIPIDITFNDGKDALNLPYKVNYIFSSHCLEHLDNWVDALNYWTSSIKQGGTLFLYLPHPEQEYWMPYNNRKHIHCLYPQMIERYLKDSEKYKNIFISQRDLNHSYMVMAERNG